MPEFKIEKFMGINNVDPAEKCKPGEFQKAINADITATGEAMLREGYTRVYVGTPHSPYGSETLSLFREGNDLKRFNGTGASVIRSGILGDRKMHYLELNGEIYYSDEVISGVTDGIADRPWGIAVPPPPLLSETIGNLIPGRYLACVTHMRANLEESGSSPVVAIDVTQGGINFSNIPVSLDPTIRYTIIYLTTSGGEVLYQCLVLLNGVTSASYQGSAIEFKTKLITQFLSPPLPCHNLQYFQGRILFARNNMVGWTEPYRYGLINEAHNYLIFDSRIGLLAPVTDGVWVGTQTKTFFCAGRDPEQFQRIIKEDYGALEDSQKMTTEVGKGGDEIRLWVWTTSFGICMGGDSGSFRNLSDDRYTIPGTPTRAPSIIKEKDEGSFYIVSLL